MQQFIDFVPLIIFFLSYKIWGILTATALLMVATGVHSLVQWKRKGELSRMEWVTLVAVALFGSFTLFFRSEEILKWKAPVVNWIMALFFFGTQWFGSQTLIQRMLGHVIQVPDFVWKRLNLAWGLFFIFLGGANLYVAMHYHSIWVDFKVFGSLGLMLVFALGQSLYLSRYLSAAKE